MEKGELTAYKNRETKKPTERQDGRRREQLLFLAQPV